MTDSLHADYLAAWQAWSDDMERTGTMRRDASAAVYAHMWSAFAHWCAEQGLPLTDLTPQRLSDYLASRATAADLSPRYAWRLLRLVERVQAHHSRRLRAQINTAATDLMSRRPDIRYANAHDADPLPDCLLPEHARRLVAFLSAVLPRDESVGSIAPLPQPADAAPFVQVAWQDLRNRAAVGLQLGAGLTPGEIRSLKLQDLQQATHGGHSAETITRIVIPDDSQSLSRETPLAQWASLLLGYWLSTRTGLAIPGDVVFPSTRSSGKAWGKVGQYESVKKVLAGAGIDATEGGSFRLRHTFAMRHLRQGVPPEQVARWLGVSDPGVLARYQRALGTAFVVV